MNIIQWNNECLYNVSITTGVCEGRLLRLLSPGSLGFHVAWDFRLAEVRTLIRTMSQRGHATFRNRPRAQDRLIDALASALTDFRLSAILLQAKEFPTL